ncbi:MAG: hypothetical protein IKY00_08310, partial [Clostridia bacterium]|nr:hypothetical protein [Clostridia bacterium]
SLFCGLFFTRKLLRTSKRWDLCVFAGLDDEEYLAVFQGGMPAQDAQRPLFEALLFYEHPPLRKGHVISKTIKTAGKITTIGAKRPFIRYQSSLSVI